MKFFNWVNIRLFLMLISVIALYSFASFKNNNRKIEKFDVEILDKNTPFILPETVNKLLIEKIGQGKTIKKVDLDLKKLEQTINEHELVQNAQLFVGVNGVVKIEVKQKSPLARYVGAEEVFYIDSQGNKMPLSDNFSARVPLISGDLNAIPRVKLSSLLQSIEADDFLKKNIVSIEILKDGDIKMQNRNFNYIIAFGKTINMDRKFSNYKAFFQKAVSDSTLYNYRTINLKFTQQVVCIK